MRLSLCMEHIQIWFLLYFILIHKIIVCKIIKFPKNLFLIKKYSPIFSKNGNLYKLTPPGQIKTFAWEVFLIKKTTIYNLLFAASFVAKGPGIISVPL